MKRAFLLTAFILISESFLGSCSLICSCGCDSGPAKQLDIQSWKVSTVDGNLSATSSSTSKDFDKVFKWLSMDSWNLVRAEETKSFYKAAYACSPAPLKAVQDFASIQIKSVVEVSYDNDTDLIKVGDDITSRFVMGMYYGQFVSVNDFIKEHSIYNEDLYLLRLKSKPHQQTDLRFDIIITLSDGKVFELKNEQLVVF